MEGRRAGGRRRTPPTSADSAAGPNNGTPAGAPETIRREGRRALVTGAGVRVGRAIALGLAKAGYDVIAHYHSSREGAEEVAATARRIGRRAFAVQADLARPEEIDALFGRAGDELGGLELLVNSAAIFPYARPEDVTLALWDRVFALNTRAPFLCARAAAALMGREGGSIVNIVDIAAFEAWTGYVPYAATKAALVSLTRGLALAWAPRVRVNAVAPGPILLPEGTSEEEAEQIIALTALGRLGSPEDVVQAVLYLDAASYVTGEVLRVDGGTHLK